VTSGSKDAKHGDFMIRKIEKKVQSLKEFEDGLKVKYMPFVKK